MSAPKLDAADADDVAADVNADLAAGQGAKHFQDLLDDMESTQGSARVVETPDVTEELHRFMLAFKRGLGDQLKGTEAGFVCLNVCADGMGTGFMCSFRDKTGRPFNVHVTYDDGFAQAAEHGTEQMGRGMMELVIGRLLAAREKWFARMQ